MMAATGAGFAAGCESRTTEKLIPYLEQPGDVVTGVARHYATTCRECPAGCGVLARTREGRVVKLEGNPQDPRTGGALCARGQAALQGLYNPDRLITPLIRREDGKLHEADWDEALSLLSQKLAQAAGSAPNAVAFLTGETSDSDAEMISIAARAWGARQPLNLRLSGEAPIIAASGALFGIEAAPEFHFEVADTIVSFGADFNETWGNPVAHASGFAGMHSWDGNTHGRALYVGPRRSNTAAACDEWIRLAPGLEAAGLRIVADGILRDPFWIDPAAAQGAAALLESVPLAEAEAAVGPVAGRLRQIGGDLQHSSAPLVIASGLGPDAETAHALAMLITWLAGGAGTTMIFYDRPRPARGDSLQAVQSLIEDAASGAVGALLIHQANPVYMIPATAESMASAPFVAYFGTQYDETAAAAHVVIPIDHPLESWGFHAGSSDDLGIVQPAMRAVFGSRPFGDLLPLIAPEGSEPLPWDSAKAFVEARFRALAAQVPMGPSLEDIKRRGGIGLPTNEVIPEPAAGATVPAWEPPEGEGLSTLLYPHPYLFDGRGADKPWLQETPETSTAATWGTWAEVSPKTAAQLNIGRGDTVLLAANDREISAPVLVTDQVMPGVIAVALGQGHTELGRWAKGRGANAFSLAQGDAGMVLAGLRVNAVAAGRAAPIVAAGSQYQGTRGLARAVEAAHAGEHHEDHAHEYTLYPEHEYPNYDWGMVIDLDRCDGCGACVVACHAENNIPFVGPDRVAEGREMSWIRIERYADGDDVRLLPVLCQHCHHAPCEPVCPVNAAFHTEEGTNAQIYNRCVGTRYCANNCVYKVRRFNFFDYKFPTPMHLQLNPDVTVRERGVMEKCTFCLQRIKEAKETASRENRKVADGEVVPACMQTCPTGAISFGNLLDENSRVRTMAADPRAYRLLEELGTRPSIYYLKKVLRTKGGEA